MNKTLGILFFLRKAKTNQTTGQVPIYLRITVDGGRTEWSIKREIDPARWNPAAGKARGTNEETKALNSYIDTLRGKVLEHQRKLIDSDKAVTAISIKNSLLGINEKGKTLFEVIDYHSNQMKSLLGTDYTFSTIKGYKTSELHLKNFLKSKHQCSDIPLKQIDHSFISEYDFYLRSDKKLSNNSVVKYIKLFKKIVKIALANAWMEKDPFINFKTKLKVIEKQFLTKGELKALCEKEISIERLALVRDIFVFSSYTGLAYIDCAKLTKDNIVTGIDGELWIDINRTKTDIKSKIPLLLEAKEVLEKYSQYPVCLHSGRVLPVLSNQKMNAYLKELADICGINKSLTFHVARYTFATTITMANNVPIETIAKMMGHTNTVITSSYAKIMDRKLADDMQKLKATLA